MSFVNLDVLRQTSQQIILRTLEKGQNRTVLCLKLTLLSLNKYKSEHFNFWKIFLKRARGLMTDTKGRTYTITHTQPSPHHTQSILPPFKINSRLGLASVLHPLLLAYGLHDCLSIVVRDATPFLPLVQHISPQHVKHYIN